MSHMIHHHKIFARKTLKANKAGKFLPKAVLFMAVVEPLMTVPQVYEVWINRQTAGVSIITWGFMFIASITWLTYSLRIKDIPLITASTIWAIMEGLIVTGILIFN